MNTYLIRHPKRGCMRGLCFENNSFSVGPSSLVTCYPSTSTFVNTDRVRSPGGPLELRGGGLCANLIG